MKNTPRVCERGVEDNSLTDHTANDPEMEMTKRKASTIQEANTTESDKKLQVCLWSWRKITVAKGLKIHQGKKKCLIEIKQGSHIDQYFLRSQSSQSSEFQPLDSTQISQDISPPASEEVKHRGRSRRRCRAHTARKTSKVDETFTNQTKSELAWSFTKKLNGRPSMQT